MLRSIMICLAISVFAASAGAHPVEQTKVDFVDKFRQLEELLPTPNVYRTASGAPGHAYWQQRADYTINVTLDDENQRLEASETITYQNNSPDRLSYLWVQLDQNRFREDSEDFLTRTGPIKDRLSYGTARYVLTTREGQGGYDIQAVRDAAGAPLPYTINRTMMRIDLPAPLAPGAQVTFSIDWAYIIMGAAEMGARGGWEYFSEDENYLYGLTQWFPRMAAYTDNGGWQHKQFLGRGEFTLEFGDYDVTITVPADHIVGATGELQNPGDVLTSRQRERLAAARTADKPVMIVTEREARRAERRKSDDTKTWHFKAENVRDFAWTSSRKFIWDAQGYTQPGDGRTILAMSFYPKEGNPLWERYSTHAVIHTLEVYSKYTFNYPYPVAISVNGPISGGMEYPMVSFQGPRPVKDDAGNKTYSRRAKYGLISVIIHEVGHNYFPMIVNSDERQWTWMDEGFNTFVQFLAEQEWEENYPARRGDPRNIIPYMVSENQVPIMTNSESILQFGNNAYAKPATAFNILRETILGRELFDFAWQEYSKRWMFKRPHPADFFRTMEDASGVDLDWFWRGWFYSTDHVDISLDKVRQYQVDTRNPDTEEPLKRAQKAAEPESLTSQRNRGMERRVDRFPDLEDFYNEHDEFTVTDQQRNEYDALVAALDPWERDLLKRTEFFYVLDFSNIGGLVMPIILDIEYTDGGHEELRIAAEIWRRNHRHVSKMLVRDKEIRSITVDPHWETADADVHNNHWPRKPVKSRLELYKHGKSRNLMKEMETPRQKN